MLLRTGQGTDMTASSSIRSALRPTRGCWQAPASTASGWWQHGRLAFERFQQRLARYGSGVAEGAGRWPAHYVVFDPVPSAAAWLVTIARNLVADQFTSARFRLENAAERAAVNS
ncbi:hypothetical protein [Streptomyces longwoodensis]|uniref:hypothetical protein n=1 Tax=Streptomyces longwoodensis TaxID=68231 RepID=UPI00384A94C2